MVILGFSQSLSFWRPRVAGQIATTPSAFAGPDWSVVDATTGGAATVSVLSLPANGGSAITGLEYDLDLSGAWQSAGIAGPGNFVISGLADGASVSVRLRAVNGMGPGAASGAKAVVPTLDTVAPSVAGVTINQATNEIDVTGVSEAGTFLALVDGVATPMSGAAIEAAVLAQTPAAFVSFPLVPGANRAVMDKTGVAGGTVYLHATVRDAAGNYSADVPLAFTQPGDVVPPVLSAPQAAAAGSSGATASVSTNEAGGTLYAVLSRSPVAPTPAQLRAGQDDSGATADWAGSQPVGAAGVQTLSPAPAGLAAGTTYYAHFLQDDAAGNASAVVGAAGFGTAAAGANPASRASATTVAPAADTIDVSLPAGIVPGDRLVIALAHFVGKAPAAPAGWTLLSSLSNVSGINREASVYRRVADGSEGATVTFAYTGGWSEGGAVAVAVRDATGFGAAVAANSGATSSTTYTGPTVPITADGGMLMTVFLQNSALSGTDLVAQVDAGGESVGIFARTGLGAGTSPAITATAAGSQTWAAMSFELAK